MGISLYCVYQFLVDFFFQSQEDQLHWRPVFYIASAVYIVGGISYLILGTGKEQQWNQSYYSARVGSDKGDTKPLLEDDKYQSADGIYAASHGDKLSS